MKLEVFFDYICPYCYRGQDNLEAMLKKYPRLEILWRPCEAHPRPEPARVHSDVAIEGMYFLQEAGGDVDRYNHLVYEAHYELGQNIADPALLAKIGGKCGANAGEMEKALREHWYKEKVVQGNQLAWGEKKLEAVPSYCAGDRVLGSGDGFMVPRDDLDHFLKELDNR